MIDEAVEKVVRRVVREELGSLRMCAAEHGDPRADDQPEVLTVPEVAEVLRISRGRVYDLVKEGGLHSLRVGRRLLVPRRAVDELLGYETREPLRGCRYCDRDAFARYFRKNDDEQVIAPVDLCEAEGCHERLLADLRTIDAIG